MAQSAFGLASFAIIAWLLSESRRRVSLAGVAAGLAAQLALAVLLVKLPGSQYAFLLLNRAVTALQDATAAGTGFVFGYLGGAPLPYVETRPGAAFILAFQALPLVIVISALSALLFYWRILPVVVGAF
ncbi:MAG: Na+ dependent nucleoside transporter N-terminal domain-containing protein, partial [Alphaproteobacteria bacterium]